MQALHLKLGQGAKTGTGGHLPGTKVVGRIAEVRGLPEGTPAVSPARFTDWTTLLDARALVDRIRERSGGIPIGVKMSAQHIEADLDAALDLGVDYVILDGRGGGTGAAPTIFRDTISVPTMAALARARRHLDLAGARDVTLVATGGFRRAAGHGQGAGARRRRDRGLQRGAAGDRLRRDAGVPHRQLPGGHRHPEAAPARPAAGERAAEQLTRYLGAITELMVVLARACGHDSLSHFTPRDLTSWKRDVAELVGVAYAGVSRDEHARVAPASTTGPRRGTGAHRGRRRPQSVAVTRCGGARRRARQPLPAPGRPAGRGLDRERAGCAARGTATTTTRPPAARRQGSPTRRSPSTSRSATTASTSSCPTSDERPRTVSDVLVETLVAWGVDTVFGMVGHSNLGFADALRKAEERGELRYIGIRHEGAAAFAASAYGKLTGRPAACFAIAGPGSTNLLTGLYDAKLDGAPVLAISGQVPSKVLGRGAFQDVDLSAVFRDVAASTVTVHAGSDHAELAATAVKHAIDGRGVAHLVLPDEVQDLPSDAPAAVSPRRTARPTLAVAPDGDALDAAVERLRDRHAGR